MTSSTGRRGDNMTAPLQRSAKKIAGIGGFLALIAAMLVVYLAQRLLG